MYINCLFFTTFLMYIISNSIAYCRRSTVLTPHSGWTGLGDFVDGRGMDCNIHISGVKIWWAVIIAMHFFQLLFSMQVLKEMKAVGRTSSDKNFRCLVATNIEAVARIVEASFASQQGGWLVPTFSLRCFTVSPEPSSGAIAVRSSLQASST